MSAAIPSRRSGWSSTARIRMGLGGTAMKASPRILDKLKSAALCCSRVRDSSRNNELHLRPSSQLAPDVELPAEACRAFAHSLKAPVPGAMSLDEDWSVDACSIIANAQRQ